MKRIIAIIPLIFIITISKGQVPQEVYDRINEIEVLKNQKDYPKVIEKIDEALERYPFMTNLYYHRALANFRQNKVDAARNDFNKFKRLNPTEENNFLEIMTSPYRAAELLSENYISEFNPDPNYYFRQKTTHSDSLQGGLRPARTCYDVTYYNLSLHIFPKEKSIKGSNSIHFKVIENTSEIQIDLNAAYKMEIVWEEKNLEFTRDCNAVFVKFPRQLSAGEMQSIKVNYSGIPREAPQAPWNGGFVWKKKKRKHWIGVACEHLGSSSWWPSKDHLSDKPDSMSVTIFCPPEHVAISNGNLVNSGKTDEGEEFFTWFVSYPINSYNVTFYIGDFVTLTDTVPNQTEPYPIDYYVIRGSEKLAKEYYARTVDIFNVYDSIYGIYPYIKDGAAMVEAPYTGMEHQSAIAIGDEYKETRRNYTNKDFKYLVVHEAAHEWWGNTIAVGDMADIWISEAFATYSELLIMEAFLGYNEYIKAAATTMERIFNLWPMVGRRNVNDNAFVSGDVYTKGASMLHSLRCTINNDTLFKDVIKGFYNKYKYQIVETSDFIDYVNSRTEKDYSAFLNSFLYRKEPPKLCCYSSKNGNDIELVYKWENVEQGFEMPFCVIYENSQSKRLMGTTEFKHVVLKNTKTFYIPNWDRYMTSMPKNSFTYFWIKDLHLNEAKSFYTDGTIKNKGTTLGEAPHGTWRSYYENGSIATVQQYSLGKKDGYYIELSENGDTLSKAMFVNDTVNGLVVNYRDNLPVEEGRFYDDKRDGAFMHYYPGTEAVESKGLWKNNIRTGTWNYYSPKGNLACSVQYSPEGSIADAAFYDSTGNGLVITDTVNFTSQPPQFRYTTELLYNRIYEDLKKVKYNSNEELNSTVIISMVISPYGKIVSADVVKSFSEPISESIINTLFSNNEWLPGYLNDNPVYSRIVFPVKIKVL